MRLNKRDNSLERPVDDNEERLIAFIEAGLNKHDNQLQKRPADDDEDDEE